jgi:hypothetical protein
MPAAERRRYALTGPPPPGWFTDMRPAPWIDGNVISEGRKLAGCPWSMSRPSLASGARDNENPASKSARGFSPLGGRSL